MWCSSSYYLHLSKGSWVRIPLGQCVFLILARLELCGGRGENRNGLYGEGGMRKVEQVSEQRIACYPWCAPPKTTTKYKTVKSKMNNQIH
jgi:hypothetical protein